MDICYFDRSNQTDALGVWEKDAQIFPAGTNVYAMPISQKGSAYKEFSESYDIHFIFSDNVPHADFYAVPFLSIFAASSSGGLFASVGELPDFESDAKIAYIAPDRTVYLAAENGQAFLENAPFWKDRLTPFSGIELFENIDQAKSKYQFIDFH